MQVTKIHTNDQTSKSIRDFKKITVLERDVLLRMKPPLWVPRSIKWSISFIENKLSIFFLSWYSEELWVN